MPTINRLDKPQVTKKAVRDAPIDAEPSGQRQSEWTARFLDVIAQNLPLAAVHERLAALTCELINARSVRWVPDPITAQSDSQPGQPAGESRPPMDDAFDGDHTEQQLYQRAVESKRTFVERSVEGSGVVAVAIPCPGRGVLLCRFVAQPSQIPTFVALLKMSAGYFGLAGESHRQSRGLQVAAQLQTRLSMMEAALASGDPEQVIVQWCDQLTALTGTSLAIVYLGKPGRRRGRLVSGSGDAMVSDGETARLARRLADEAMLLRMNDDVDLESGSNLKSGTAHALATQSGVESVVAIPFVDGGGNPRGAVILAGPEIAEDSFAMIRHAIATTIPALLLRLGIQTQRSIEPSRPIAGRIVLGLLCTAAAVGLMFAPIPFHVRAPASLVPQVRRVVPAPYDSVLTEALVRPGDVVRLGQPIAHLDAEPLRLELSRKLTEQVRVRKQQEIHLAETSVADAQLAELRLAELAAEIELLEKRIDQATILAPIGGVVVQGDLKEVEDSPVELGQPLFEVAPLETLRVEIEIPEYHWHSVAKDQQASMWIDDGRGTHFSGQLDRIAPSLTLSRDQSVLLCEMSVDNKNGQLRPGMDGTVSIDAGTKPLGWVVFNRLWNRARVLIGV